MGTVHSLEHPLLLLPQQQQENNNNNVWNDQLSQDEEDEEEDQIVLQQQEEAPPPPPTPFSALSSFSWLKLNNNNKTSSPSAAQESPCFSLPLLLLCMVPQQQRVPILTLSSCDTDTIAFSFDEDEINLVEQQQHQNGALPVPPPSPAEPQVTPTHSQSHHRQLQEQQQYQQHTNAQVNLPRRTRADSDSSWNHSYSTCSASYSPTSQHQNHFVPRSWPQQQQQHYFYCQQMQQTSSPKVYNIYKSDPSLLLSSDSSSVSSPAPPTSLSSSRSAQKQTFTTKVPTLPFRQCQKKNCTCHLHSRSKTVDAQDYIAVPSLKQTSDFSNTLQSDATVAATTPRNWHTKSPPRPPTTTKTAVKSWTLKKLSPPRPPTPLTPAVTTAISATTAPRSVLPPPLPRSSSSRSLPSRRRQLQPVPPQSQKQRSRSEDYVDQIPTSISSSSSTKSKKSRRHRRRRSSKSLHRRLSYSSDSSSVKSTASSPPLPLPPSSNKKVYHKQRSRSEDLVDLPPPLLKSASRSKSAGASISSSSQSVLSAPQTTNRKKFGRQRSQSDDIIDVTRIIITAQESSSHSSSSSKPRRTRRARSEDLVDVTPNSFRQVRKMSDHSSTNNDSMNGSISFKSPDATPPPPPPSGLRSRSNSITASPAPSASSSHVSTNASSTKNKKSSEAKQQLQLLPPSPTSVMDEVVMTCTAAESTGAPTSNKQPPIPRHEAWEMALNYEYEGQWELAMKLYRSCIDQTGRQDYKSLAKIYHRLGLVHWKLSNYKPALRVLTHAMDLYALSYGCWNMDEVLQLTYATEVIEWCAESMLIIGQIYMSTGQLKQAKKNFKTTLTLLQSNHDTKKQKESLWILFAKALRLFGSIYTDSKPELAMKYTQQAYDTLQYHGDRNRTIWKENMAATLNALGVLYINIHGWYGYAMQCHTQALQLYYYQHPDVPKPSYSPMDMAVTLYSIGWIHYSCGDYKKALKACTDALRLLPTSMTSHRNVLIIQSLMGMIYASKEQGRDALKIFKSVLSRQRALLGDDHMDIVSTLNAISIVYAQMGNVSKAIVFLERAMEVHSTPELQQRMDGLLEQTLQS